MSEVPQLLQKLKPKLYSESNVAKIYGVAAQRLNDAAPPTEYPEYSFKRYSYRDVDYWTSGFFPGSLYALLERFDKYPKFFSKTLLPLKLEHGAKWWTEGTVAQAPRTDTHDLGFMIQPAFQREWERNKNDKALEVLKTAANALASRFSETAGVIRSWDTAVNKRYSFTDLDSDFIVIIDNMCNLSMLYYIASVTGDLRLSTIATTHAENTLKHHFRHPEWSCYHVVNYERSTGEPKAKFTNQGYADESTWSRGQAWAILGFAETYMWTKNKKFLNASIESAKFFLSRLPEDGVPQWDFDAPDGHVKDTSAAMITANALLILYEATKDDTFLVWALKLANSTVELSYVDGAHFNEDLSVEFGEYDTILKDATINNNPDTFQKLVSHGLVYADYYFLTFGNKLLELGLYK
jgi:hypothetical protein